LHYLRGAIIQNNKISGNTTNMFHQMKIFTTIRPEFSQENPSRSGATPRKATGKEGGSDATRELSVDYLDGKGWKNGKMASPIGESIKTDVDMASPIGESIKTDVNMESPIGGSIKTDVNMASPIGESIKTVVSMESPIGGSIKTKLNPLLPISSGTK
jgi:hypothetical protein